LYKISLTSPPLKKGKAMVKKEIKETSTTELVVKEAGERKGPENSKAGQTASIEGGEKHVPERINLLLRNLARRICEKEPCVGELKDEKS